MANKNRDYLSVVYDKRPKTEYPNLLARELMKRFNLNPDMSLLDVGCGQGEMLEAFKTAGLEVKGLDLAPSALDREDSIEISQCDVTCETYPYGDGLFDAVFAKSVIEHVVDPTNMLAEMRRVLKPGGVLILLTPDFSKLHTVFYEDPTHVHPYVPKSVQALLMMNDFSAPEAELFCHHQLLWKDDVYKLAARTLQLCLSVESARWLTEKTGLKFIRWSVERQVLASAQK